MSDSLEIPIKTSNEFNFVLIFAFMFSTMKNINTVRFILTHILLTKKRPLFRADSKIIHYPSKKEVLIVLTPAKNICFYRFRTRRD